MLANASDGTSPPPPQSKHNPYAEAADPQRYRVADAPLFTCAAHTEACVLCTTAGKNGRNGRTAAVGATLFWLTCPHLNALIARMEGHRCVQVVTEAMAQHARLLQWHVASHAVYAARARALLTDAQWNFFEAHFLQHENVQLRKFGNAAVSHPEDMKCLHALVAQTLAAAANPVGSIVVNYVLFLHELTCLAEAAVATQEEKRADLRAALDRTELFVRFVEACATRLPAWKNEESGAFGNSSSPAPSLSSSGTESLRISLASAEVFGVPEVFHEWLEDASLATLTPDLCARALHVLVFLEGKPPRRHKKHRIN